jgi:hypothetical protein
MEILVLVGALVALGIAAQIFGADSRPVDPYPREIRGRSPGR